MLMCGVGRCRKRMLPAYQQTEDAENVASYEQVMSVHVHALEHTCGYLGATGTRTVSVLVLKVRSPGGWSAVLF